MIRLKIDSFKIACTSLDIVYKEANPILEQYDPYFSG
jgi:hypothetical protein